MKADKNVRRLLAGVVTAGFLLSQGAVPAAAGADRASDCVPGARTTGKPDDGAEFSAEETAQIYARLQERLRSAPAIGPGHAAIKVHFWVIHSGATGKLPRKALQAQIDVLNRAYSGGDSSDAADTPYRFTLASVGYRDNKSWLNVEKNSTAERQMKRALKVGGPEVLNIYTALPRSRDLAKGETLLGYATFPFWYEGAPDNDGVVLRYDTLPGVDPASSTGLGMTGVHEVGHWLGLFHTFQGGCKGPGDYVGDTPPQALSTTGCPKVGRDSCKGGSRDPIHNFMDYSDDRCLNQFTPGQVRFSSEFWASYRYLKPNLSKPKPKLAKKKKTKKKQHKKKHKKHKKKHRKKKGRRR